MRRAGGFSLVEVLLALFLLSIAVLAAAPMFIYGMRSIASAADFGGAAAKAVERMEQLRGADLSTLVAGGGLDTNVSSYFDASDPDYLVRWQVTDNASPAFSKTLRVRVIARREVVGRAKSVTVALLRSR